MMALSPDEGLSLFLDKFPIPLHHILSKSWKHFCVFWSQDEETSEINSSSADPMLQNHIKSAFSNLECFAGNVIVQLWAPTVTISGRILLSTSAQPFALILPHNDDLIKYRLRCMEYHYTIHANNHQVHHHQQQQNPKILTGGPAAAFLNRMPEFAHFKDHQGSPLARYALEECRLETCILLPVCSPSQTSSSCIGVVECTFNDSYDLGIIGSMKKLLEEAGLSVCPIQERIPYKTINGLKPTRDDIEAALKIVCGSHNLDVAQVWIPYVDENHEPFSFSMEVTQTELVIALKLTGYLKKDSILIHDGAEDYCNSCDVVHLEAEEELVKKTLKDYKPRFCKSIYKLSDDTLLAYAFSGRNHASCVAICLRSMDTCDLDYVFEFIWYHTSTYVILLEALLLTLKKCLPRFKFASGAELGDELELLVIDDSPDTNAKASDELESHSYGEVSDKLELHNDAEGITESEIKSCMIFQRKISSPLPIALEAGMKPMVVDSCKPIWKTAPKQLSEEDIKKEYGNTMKEAARNLEVSLSTLKRYLKKYHIYEWQGNAKKRKVKDSSSNQSNRNEKDHEAIQEPSIFNRTENTLTIKAKYERDMIKVKLHISEATFVNVEKEIGKKLNLSHGTYKLKYRDKDEDLILLTSDQDMSDCIEYFVNLGQPVVRLRVLLSKKPSSY